MIFHERFRQGMLRGLAGALLLAMLACRAHADGAAVWAISGEKNTVYLAGSVHALPRENSGIPPELDLAYRAADALVMEVDLDDMNPLEAVQFIAAKGTLPADKTLADVMGAEDYADVSSLAASVDLPEMAIARLEPWAAAMVLTQFALAKRGYDPQLGIEMQLADRARADGKQIEGLESIIDQLGIFDARSPGEQSEFLRDAVKDVPKLDEDLGRLIRAWRSGDLRALEREMQAERARAPGLYDELLGNRNRKWLPQIEALLDDDRNYLIVVGTLHFVGGDGLLALLRKSGHEPTALASGSRDSGD